MIRDAAALNELSWLSDGNDQATGRALLDGLAATHDTLLRCLGRSFRLHHDGTCRTAEVAPAYRLDTWFRDQQASAEREARRRLLSAITRYGEVSLALDVEYLVNGARAVALGWAAEHDGLLLSLATDWFVASSVEATCLEPAPGADDLIERLVAIKNAAKPEHVDKHRRWLLECPTDWQSWINEAPRLYPDLHFHDDAVRQVAKLNAEVLSALHSKLCILDDYFRNSRPTEFAPIIAEQLHLRDEKSATLSRRGDRQPALWIDGRRHILTWHAAFGDCRFYLTVHNGRCHIGYVGPHPT